MKTNQTSNRMITPLKGVANPNPLIAVFDCETLLINGVMKPYALGIQDLKSRRITTFYLKDYLTQGDSGDEAIHQAIDMMVADWVSHLREYPGYTIYAHNLGGFDGFILIRSLITSFKGFTFLMDAERKFISMRLEELNIQFLDSYRLLPVSLLELGKIFKVGVEKGILDHQNITIEGLYDLETHNQIHTYFIKDLQLLRGVVEKVSTLILAEYGVDITECFSAPSMAMKIYRTNYLSQPIEALNPELDNIIRQAYFGGSVDVYELKGTGLHYYDVNSLYPWAMTQPMPVKFLRFVEIVKSLESFFGFVEAEITIPKGRVRPVAIFREPGSFRIIHPVGVISGLYFSEELKAYKKLGYKVRVFAGVEFESGDIFSTYVTHFYEKKATTQGAERFLIKLLLNGLYGYFGRKPIRDVSEILTDDQLNELLKSHQNTHTEIEGSNLNMVIRAPHPDVELCEITNINPLNAQKAFPPGSIALSNVAIAAAITSYARVRMHPVKTNPDNPCFYTDTDSAILAKPLDESLVGPELGLFKDELNGATMEAIFLAPKLYGYKYTTSDGVLREVVKAKGIPQNTSKIPFNHLQRILDGETLTYTHTTLAKSLDLLGITRRIRTIKIAFNHTELSRKVVNQGGVLTTIPRIVNYPYKPTNSIITPHLQN